MKKSHKERAHAPLAPSSLKRTMSCPGSFVASEGIETKQSEAALEGTIAHEWIEKLRKACMSDDPNDYAKLLLKLENYDEDMAYHVDGYIDFLDKLKSKFQNSKWDDYNEYLETKVKFTDSIWGTLDSAIVRTRGLIHQAIICDFKYGRGVYVPVKNNPQLIAYLIALEEHTGKTFDKAWVYIYQPRIDKEEPYEQMVLTYDDIQKWRKKLLASEKICLDMKSGKKPLQFKAGDHCQFCPAQPQCKTFRAHTKVGSLAVLDGALPPIERIPLEVLVELHKKKKQIEHYLENVDHFLLMRGLKKQDIGDLKIVEGRANRRWVDDEDEVANGLKKLGVQPWRRKLITIGEADKKAGKKKISHLTVKPTGKLQLALPEDKRPTAQFGKDSLALLEEVEITDTE